MLGVVLESTLSTGDALGSMLVSAPVALVDSNMTGISSWWLLEIAQGLCPMSDYKRF